MSISGHYERASGHVWLAPTSQQRWLFFDNMAADLKMFHVEHFSANSPTASASRRGSSLGVSTVIAIANQKGGVGKTTSAVSIAAELGLKGFRTLLIDFDPQGNATSGLGVELREAGEDLFDLFFGRASLSKIIRPSLIKGLDVAPSSADLVGVEIELGKTPGRELILKSELSLLRESYDYVLIDCPPSSGLLTLNALGAAEKILIPLQAEYYALEGISAITRTLDFVRQTFNPRLEILGVFMTMSDSRTNLSNQVEAEARQFFGSLMFESKIPRSVKLSECPSHSKPICLYDPTSAGAKAYAALTEEVVARVAGLQSKAGAGTNQEAKVSNG